MNNNGIGRDITGNGQVHVLVVLLPRKRADKGILAATPRVNGGRLLQEYSLVIEKREAAEHRGPGQLQRYVYILEVTAIPVILHQIVQVIVEPGRIVLARVHTRGNQGNADSLFASIGGDLGRCVKE